MPRSPIKRHDRDDRTRIIRARKAEVVRRIADEDGDDQETALPSNVGA